MSTFDWQGFLATWSEEYLACARDIDHLPLEVLESRWLGFPGATEDQIRQVEDRLSIHLPPSYRNFLKVSNGWRQTTPFIYRILPIEEVDWFRVKHANWIREFQARYYELWHSSRDTTAMNGSSIHVPLVSDADYFVYGSEQDCSRIRIEYLSTCLTISERGEASIYLLNSQVVNEAGEWEAWFFGDWLPGADRYRSFREMMEAEYRNFVELKDDL